MAKKCMDTNIRIKDLIYPYFVIDGKNIKEKIPLFPAVFRFSLDRLLRDISETHKLGINKILLFGISKEKDLSGSLAFKENSIIPLAVKKIKETFPQLIVMTDVCLCGYTVHGHCGILKTDTRYQMSDVRKDKEKNLKSLFIDNEKTLEALSKMALAHAQAGADWVAPSAMAKQQVKTIRSLLDDNGYRGVKIMGYSAKFASNFYGPFRQAANSAPKFGDRKSYQLNYNNAKKALREISDDIKEGADTVMVKPALSYLDIISQAKRKFNFPLAAYNTSGEYAFVKYGTKLKLWEEKKIIVEILTSIKRAGADFIITYHAKDVAKWIKQ